MRSLNGPRPILIRHPAHAPLGATSSLRLKTTTMALGVIPRVELVLAPWAQNGRTKQHGGNHAACTPAARRWTTLIAALYERRARRQGTNRVRRGAGSGAAAAALATDDSNQLVADSTTACRTLSHVSLQAATDRQSARRTRLSAASHRQPRAWPSPRRRNAAAALLASQRFSGIDAEAAPGRTQ